MKKILVLMLLLLLLVGCSNVSNNNNPSKNDSMDNTDITIEETEWCDIDWDQIEFPIDLKIDALKEIKPIDTNQRAINIGTRIIEELHRKGKYPEFTLCTIVHSTKDNVWRFDYSIDQRNTDIDNLIECGVLYVAIDGNNGELIKAWITE